MIKISAIWETELLNVYMCMYMIHMNVYVCVWYSSEIIIEFIEEKI